MKLIKKDKEREWYLVDEWETKVGLKARVFQCKWHDEIKQIALSIHDHYTGYVQVPEGIKPDEENIEVHGGVTFSLGKLEDYEGQWIGFDMAHYGDENIQSEDYAKSECEKLAEQIK